MDNIEHEEKINKEDFLPMLRQALMPLNLCLALLIRQGHGALLHDVEVILAGLVSEAKTQYFHYNHKGAGGLQ